MTKKWIAYYGDYTYPGWSVHCTTVPKLWSADRPLRDSYWEAWADVCKLQDMSYLEALDILKARKREAKND